MKNKKAGGGGKDDDEAEEDLLDALGDSIWSADARAELEDVA